MCLFLIFTKSTHPSKTAVLRSNSRHEEWRDWGTHSLLFSSVLQTGRMLGPIARWSEQGGCFCWNEAAGGGGRLGRTQRACAGKSQHRNKRRNCVCQEPVTGTHSHHGQVPAWPSASPVIWAASPTQRYLQSPSSSHPHGFLLLCQPSPPLSQVLRTFTDFSLLPEASFWLNSSCSPSFELLLGLF